MKRFTLALALAMVFGCVAIASAATEVKMTGDARIHGTFFAKQNFTGWNGAGARTADPFTVWQRFRLRTDFIASEGLKFRLGIRVNNTAWGNGAYTVDNPAVAIDVYQAFLQFKWPGTDIEFTIGQQDILRAIGCTHGQGYLFGRAMTATAAADRLAADRLAGERRIAAA